MRRSIQFSTSAILYASCCICWARNPSSNVCLPFSEASAHVGTAECIRGTVMRVKDGRNGVTFLNFCAAAKSCPFTVVVFPADLKKMGDVHQLEGRQIEIKGTIQDFDGRPQIVLRRSQQLGQAAFFLFPTVPTDYDVERAGRNSAGSPKRPKAAKKTTAKQGEPVPIQDPEEP